jgi:hypothetical protein
MYTRIQNREKEKKEKKEKKEETVTPGQWCDWW